MINLFSLPPPSPPLQVPLLYNIHWKELGLLVFVWVAFLAVQIAKVTLSFDLSFAVQIAVHTACAIGFIGFFVIFIE